ncbi:MAG: alpha/beta hydrolase [Prolixibacteraceae bacterium]
MKSKLFIVLLLFVFTTTSRAQQFIPLYKGTPPNSQKTDEVEIHSSDGNLLKISYVQNPEIEVYLPSAKMATGEAVIICPGGGYWILAYEHEGTDFAKYFNSKGIAAFVLKYRLPVSKSNILPHKTPLMDAQRAIRLVRLNAEEWNINPNKVGIMGSSAGGHLASTLSTHYNLGDSISKDPIERLSCRPDFSILLYPVITFTGEFAHVESKNALLQSEANNEELVRFYSNELHINENTPPAIMIHAADDKGVSPNNSIVYFQALQKLGIKCELHIYPEGGHGFGLAIKDEHLSGWFDQCVNFIKEVTKE